MAAHRKLDQSRIYFCAGGLPKAVGGLNRMKSNGSVDILLSDRKDISPITALALPITGSMAVRIEAILSAFTIMPKPIEGSSPVP
jgi:hypothetical protein